MTDDSPPSADAPRTRPDGRDPDALRPVAIELHPMRQPEGSVLYRSGETTVLIAASVDDSVPDWLAGQGRGWVTAEYAMHPRANPRRQARDGRKGRVDGRSTEIQRLIGRSLRAAIAPEALGERSVTLDCDVLDADGGTRTAAITGGWVALAIALDRVHRERGGLPAGVLREPLAAVSVGLMEDGRILLDLPYLEDRDAAVDLNVVATASGRVVEVQGTAEGAPVPRERFDALLDLALRGIALLVEAQKNALDRAGIDWRGLVA